MDFEFLEHTADIKFKAYGKTLDSLYENCSLALTKIITREEKIKSAKGKTIEVSGTDHESLLYNLLEEILFLLDSEHFVISKIKITMRGYNIKADIYGDDSSKYSLDHVKAATYAEMYIKKTPNGWEAQAVVDV